MLWACSSSDCSEDATCAAPSTGNDGSASSEGGNRADTSSTADARSPTDGTATDGDTPLPAAKLVLINAAVGLGPNADAIGTLRVCFAVATKPAPSDSDFTFLDAYAMPSDAAATDALAYPGLPIGIGHPISFGDLEAVTVRPLVMNAKSLSAKGVVGQGASPKCGAILSDGGVTGGLIVNKDYWQLPDIPPGTFKRGNKYFAAVTGCTDDFAGPGSLQPVCGKTDSNVDFTTAGSPGRGNLRFSIVGVDNVTKVNPDELGVQVVNLSAPHESVKGGQLFIPVLFNGQFFDGGNGANPTGNVFPLTSGELSFDRQAPKISAVSKLKGVVTATAGITFNMETNTAPMFLNNSGNGNQGLGSVQYRSSGSQSSTEEFTNGHVYTFAFLGFPSNLLTDTRTAHFIGFEQ